MLAYWAYIEHCEQSSAAFVVTAAWEIVALEEAVLEAAVLEAAVLEAAALGVTELEAAATEFVTAPDEGKVKAAAYEDTIV